MARDSPAQLLLLILSNGVLAYVMGSDYDGGVFVVPA